MKNKKKQTLDPKGRTPPFRRLTCNLNVVRHIDKLIQVLAPCKPLELLHDGDVIYLVKILPDETRPGLTQVTEVKSHATSEMVVSGKVRAFAFLPGPNGPAPLTLLWVLLPFTGRRLPRTALCAAQFARCVSVSVA